MPSVQDYEREIDEIQRRAGGRFDWGREEQRLLRMQDEVKQDSDLDKGEKQELLEIIDVAIGDMNGWWDQ